MGKIQGHSHRVYVTAAVRRSGSPVTVISRLYAHALWDEVGPTLSKACCPPRARGKSSGSKYCRPESLRPIRTKCDSLAVLSRCTQNPDYCRRRVTRVSGPKLPCRW